jgi:MFS family permease
LSLPTRLRSFLTLQGATRRPGVDDRAVALGLGGRFTDELLSGTYTVLTPTFRQRFGLSLVAVALLDQVLAWVALVVEPPAALLIDVRSRRALMVFGAACAGAALVLIGAAPAYGVLVAGFALYGLGSGPLAHTADVVLVESFPADTERAFARSTFLDTVGALLAPLLVAAVELSGTSWRVAPLAVGAWGLAYAVLLRGTRMPPPGGRDTATPLVAQLRANLRQVAGHPEARRWLLFLLCMELYEAPDVLRYIWLNEHAGMSQAVVALYAAGEMVIGLLALAWLDRRLRSAAGRDVLGRACLAVLVLYPLWIAAPGVWGRFVVGAPLAFATALIWPVAKARSLASVPGRAGAVQAVSTLFGVLPLRLAFGVLAQQAGLTRSMLVVTMIGTALMLAVARRRPAAATVGEAG